MLYWPKLDELDDAQVDAAYAIIAQLVEEKHPELNARRGVLGDLVTELHAILQGASMAAIEQLRKSMSAEELARDPDNALPGAIDALASNYRITRRISTTMTAGTITVVLTRCGGLNFGTDMAFRARGQLLYPSESISIRPPGSKKHSRRDVAVTQLDNGHYAVQIPVVAAAVHEDSLLRRFDTVTPAVKPAGFYAAYVTHDFTGGHVPQSNADLVRQLQVGAATPGFSGPMNIKALVRSILPDVIDVAVIGACDPEMNRDRRNSDVSGGGKLDIYVRSQPYPESRLLVKTATAVQHIADTTKWEIHLDKDDAPGFYSVQDVRAVGSSTAVPAAGLDVEYFMDANDGLAYRPDVRTAEEARYTRYQSATVTFKDAGLGKHKREFEVTVLVMPGIAELQDKLNSVEVRQPGLDVLVKAPKPEWASVSVWLTEAVDTDVFAGAIARYVNNLSLGDAPQQFLIANAVPDPTLVADVAVTLTCASKEYDQTVAAFLAPADVAFNN